MQQQNPVLRKNYNKLKITRKHTQIRIAKKIDALKSKATDQGGCTKACKYRFTPSTSLGFKRKLLRGLNALGTRVRRAFVLQHGGAHSRVKNPGA